MQVFLLGLGLGASVAMTSAACDTAGGCQVPDDDVSFMQLSAVKGQAAHQASWPGQAAATTRCLESNPDNAALRQCMEFEEAASKEAAQPGKEKVVACRSEAWKTGWTTDEHKCYNDKFLSHNVTGLPEDKWVMQGPLTDSRVCISQSYRFDEARKPCSDDQYYDKVGKKWEEEVTLLQAYTGKYRRTKVAIKAQIDAWDPEAGFELPFPIDDLAKHSSIEGADLPFPFDDLAKHSSTKAEMWETRYLSQQGGDWPPGAKADAGAHWYEVPLNFGNENIQGIGRLYSTRVPRDIGDFDDGFASKFTASKDEAGKKILKDGEAAGISTTYMGQKQNGVHHSDALAFKANKQLKKVTVVVSLIIDKDLEDKALKSKGGNMIEGVYGHDELAPNGANSKGLWRYYKELGLTVLRCPLNDFNTPNTDQFVECMERISVYIAEGRNVVVHCFGGSGRTGTVMMGVAKTFGVPNVIEWGRNAPGKDTYLDVHEQELFVDQMPRVNTAYMREQFSKVPGLQATIDRRFKHAVDQAEKKELPIAKCDDHNRDTWIPMQEKCWMYGNCRGCMGWGDGKPGSYPEILQEHIHLPLGDERAPAPLTPEGKTLYNYWLNSAAYFSPLIQEPF